MNRFALPIMLCASWLVCCGPASRNSPPLKPLRPRPVRLLEGSSFARLLGKARTTPDLQAVIQRIGQRPRIVRFSDCTHYLFTAHGISFRFDRGDRLTTVFFYDNGADDFQRYRGRLPAGLTFKDIRASVEEKLGRGSGDGGGGVIRFWATYPRRGVTVTYWTKSTTDLRNRIHHLSLTRPRREESPTP